MDEQRLREIVREEVRFFIKSDRFVFEKLVQFAEGKNVQAGTNVGTQIGTTALQKISLYGKTPVVQQVIIDLTNSVTIGGGTDGIADYADLVTYSADAATIRNNFYQLARKGQEFSRGRRGRLRRDSRTGL